MLKAIIRKRKYQSQTLISLLLFSLMNLMLRVDKNAQTWKERKVVMLLKQYNKENKDNRENWKPITLTDIICGKIFGRIAEYFQDINADKKVAGDEIDCKEQKGFSKNIEGCCNDCRKINYLIASREPGKRVYIKYGRIS
jgi:hypothetical protein